LKFLSAATCGDSRTETQDQDRDGVTRIGPAAKARKKTYQSLQF